MGFIRAGKAFVGDLMHAKPQNALHSNEAINGNFFTNFGSRLDHAVGVMVKSMDRHVIKVKNSGKMAELLRQDTWALVPQVVLFRAVACIRMPMATQTSLASHSFNRM